MPKVKITDPRYSHEFPVSVNGVITRVSAKEPMEVSDAVVDVLRHSVVEFEVEGKDGFVPHNQLTDDGSGGVDLDKPKGKTDPGVPESSEGIEHMSPTEKRTALSLEEGTSKAKAKPNSKAAAETRPASEELGEGAERKAAARAEKVTAPKK